MSKALETMKDYMNDLETLIDEATEDSTSIDRINAALRGRNIQRGFLTNQFKVARETNCVNQLKEFYGLK